MFGVIIYFKRELVVVVDIIVGVEGCRVGFVFFLVLEKDRDNYLILFSFFYFGSFRVILVLDMERSRYFIFFYRL